MSGLVGNSRRRVLSCRGSHIIQDQIQIIKNCCFIFVLNDIVSYNVACLGALDL